MYNNSCFLHRPSKAVKGEKEIKQAISARLEMTLLRYVNLFRGEMFAFVASPLVGFGLLASPSQRLQTWHYNPGRTEEMASPTPDRHYQHRLALHAPASVLPLP